MKTQKFILVSCSLAVLCILAVNARPQGTGKVQEFFKKYFGEYYPKTTRSYTLYGNGLNGPADFNAGLPVAEDRTGPIKSIIIRRGSPAKGSTYQQPGIVPVPDSNTWQPVPNFDPVAFAKGGHRGRSDLAAELDDEAESRIITAEDALAEAGEGTREFRMESSMSFSPGSVHSSSI